MTPTRSAVVYWHRMNTARWKWKTSMLTKESEAVHALVRAANERAKKMYPGPSEVGFESVLERDGLRRGPGGYAYIPWEALEEAGLGEAALRTWLS